MPGPSEAPDRILLFCSEPSCPQCRMAMQSRRDCKRDARLDRLLGILYADIGAYEDQVRGLGVSCVFG